MVHPGDDRSAGAAHGAVARAPRESPLNRPTPLGRQVGAWLGELTDAAEPFARLEFPQMPPRCKSCAFRGGSIPNGCEETLIEAIKCAAEGVPFYCHLRFKPDGSPIDLCSGWVMLHGSPPAKVLEMLPTHEWDFSDDGAGNSPASTTEDGQASGMNK